LLGAALIQGAEDDLPPVLALKSVYLDEEHEQFHDYRKLLR